jgi:hypothetical protein
MICNIYEIHNHQLSEQEDCLYCEITRLTELYNDAGKEMFVLHAEIDRLTAANSALQKEVEMLGEKSVLRIAWLIERTSTLWGIEWFCAGADRWTRDANKAILFPDKASAEEAATHYGWYELPVDIGGGACGTDWVYHLNITEHGFMGG